MSALRSLLWGATLLLVGAGCDTGPKLVIPKVQLTYKQQPLKVDPKAGVTLVLVAEGEKANSYPADWLNRDQVTFTIPGREGKGIPLGKYRVTLNQMTPGVPSADIQAMNELYTKDKTPIVCEVKDDPQPIVIDLSKPGG